MIGMNPCGKYQAISQIKLQDRKWPSNSLEKAPVWCSVDLRDGNQALENPMGIDVKLKFFDFLVKLGFKEIEIGFPASSDTEFLFCRRLIEENHIPEDVTIQVLCQARDELLKKTLKALEGANKVIFHLYNSTSPAQRKYTFNKSKEEIKALAVEGVNCIISSLSENDKNRIRLEYSPESFSMTEIDFAVEICEAVKTEWKKFSDDKVILNLPSTVECSTPNIYADQIEYFINHISDRENVIISTHCHNDRGTSVASCELALLAGAERVEGCLFGNGERTGNLDIVNLALNLFSQGINPMLDFSDINYVRQIYEEYTGMNIFPRTPYAGDLVFTAFSGSHQDAISKGLSARKNLDKNSLWDVPYLLIDPHDIGREYEGIIRINSQSGKGGAAFILESEYGLFLPKAMHYDLGVLVKKEADNLQRELKPEELYSLFEKQWILNFKNLEVLDLAETHLEGKMDDSVKATALCRAMVSWKGEKIAIGEKGNGPLDAFVSALKQTPAPSFNIVAFHEHSIGTGSDTFAMAYVQIKTEDDKTFWGVGKSTSVGRAGINAVVSALNQI